MKRLAVALAFTTGLLPLASARGQGTVNFSNRVLSDGVDAPVFAVDGVTRLDGDGFVAQLYAGPSADTLSPIGGAVAFSSGARAGYFFGGTRVIATVPPGGVAFVQVRVWAGAFGSTFEAAWAAGGDTGQSELFQVVTGGNGAPPSIPANLVGLESFKLVAATPPTITLAPASREVIAGATVTFTVAAAGSEPLSFQWRKNGLDLPGAVSPTLVLESVQASDAGEYVAIVRNFFGTATSAPAQLAVQIPPALTAPPQRRVVLAGTEVSLHAAATGTAPLAFQWRKDGADLVGATSPTLTLARVTPAATGYYSVLVRNPAGEILSPVAALEVHFRLVALPGAGGAVSIEPAQASFAPGSTVALTAVPNRDLAFTGWSGDATGNANPLVVTMDAHKTITANFQPAYALSAEVTGEGSVAVSPLKDRYAPGEVVRLTALPAEGWAFVNWSGAVTAATATVALTMDRHQSVTANFKRLRSLTTTVAGQGAIIRSPDAARYLDGAVVQLTATAAPGWQFVGWTGAASGLTDRLSVPMDADKEVRALFLQVFTVNARVEGDGSVTWAPLQANYLDGTEITVTATPGRERLFLGWSGDLTSVENPAKLVVNSPKTFTAHFGAGYPLVVKTLGRGRVMRSPGADVYLPGQIVTLTAVAEEGWQFAGWEGAVEGATESVSVTMAGELEARARFTPAQAPSFTELGFEAQLGVEPGKTYLIEASTDLKTWTILAPAASADGTLRVLDLQARSHELRFYRARWVE